nr:MAG TPA: Helicase REPLICATION [Herelleviridae sp.]
MINVLFYSIAGKKPNESINTILIDLLNQDYINQKDKITIKHVLEVGENGHYPSKEYFEDFYEPAREFKSLSEIKTYVIKMKDYYAREKMIVGVMKVVNESMTLKDMTEGIYELADKTVQTDDGEDDNDGPITYSDLDDRPGNVGFYSGVQEIDAQTNGFQPGTIASVCAFVSEGKSTFWVSSIYKNIKEGKKGVLFSLEMHPNLIWMQFQSRFLFEEKSIDIKATELINRTLTDEKAKLVAQHDEEFREFMKGLIIWDESRINKKIMEQDRLLKQVLKKAEMRLGGLDFIVWDHVNQFDLMYEGIGNTCIKTIQSVIKTYKNQDGMPLFCGFAVQTNREGWKRAKKRDGKYDIAAISDLNEVERSSTYVVFLYTTEDMRMTQETKMTLAKNRLGSLLVEPVVTTFNPTVMVVGDIISKVEYQDDFSELSAGGMEDFDMDDF